MDVPTVTGHPCPRADTGVGCYCLRSIPVTVLATTPIQEVFNSLFDRKRRTDGPDIKYPTLLRMIQPTRRTWKMIRVF